MNEHFAVGEIARIKYAQPMCSYFIGRECTVLTPLDLVIPGNNPTPIMAYGVMIEGETRSWWAKPHCLQKLRPPGELGSWEALKGIYQPPLEVVTVKAGP